MHTNIFGKFSLNYEKYMESLIETNNFQFIMILLYFKDKLILKPCYSVADIPGQTLLTDRQTDIHFINLKSMYMKYENVHII